MIVFVYLDRERKATSYPWLQWKIRFFVAGSALAVIGMATEHDWLLLAGVGVLFIGFLLRFLPGGKGEVNDELESS